MTALAKKKKSMRLQAISYIGVVIAVLIDQFTKYLANAYLNGRQARVLIPGVFEFRYLENESAAFGVDFISLLDKIFHFAYFEENPDAFLRTKMLFFVVVTLIVVAVLLLLYRRLPWERHWLAMNLIILAFTAGAIGNLIDRIVHNYVIDFLYFSLIDFPIFNVADIYVTVASFALIFSVFFVYTEEDFEAVFPKKKRESQKEEGNGE